MRLTILAAVSAALALAACGTDDPPASSDLADAQAKFADAALASYSFTWVQRCFCGDDRTRATRVTVVDGAITSAVYLDDQSPSKNPDVQTIDGLFARIQRGYDQHYDAITVTYDPGFGFPSKVFLDPVKAAADEETQIEIIDFVTVSPQAALRARSKT